jgi:hypothetical protein
MNRIIITEALKRDLIAAWEKLGSAEFLRLFHGEMGHKGIYKNSKYSIYDFLNTQKYISSKMAEKVSNIVDLDRYTETSHFQVCSMEDIEYLSGVPVSEHFSNSEECINVYSELGRSFIRKIDEMIYQLIKRNDKDPALWGLAFAVGSKILDGRSMTAIAKDIGVTRAAISKHATFYSRTLSLPRSPYQKNAQNIPLYQESARAAHQRKKDSKQC